MSSCHGVTVVVALIALVLRRTQRGVDRRLGRRSTDAGVASRSGHQCDGQI
jgi:hypothetical protein